MRILVADDHPLVRDALARTVASLDSVVEVHEAADLPTLREQAREHDFDLALVDLNMPGMHGIAGLRALRTEFPTLVLIVASAQDDAATIRSVLATGVSGFIPKIESRDVVLQAIRLVQAGGVYVPSRILSADDGPPSAPAPLAANGAEAALTPRQLGLTEGTVKIHIAAILRCLDVSNRTEAVVRARELGLLQG